MEKTINDSLDWLAPVQQDGKWGFINEHGKLVIEPRFEWVFKFSNGLARIQQDGKIGFINKHGEIVIEPRFKYASGFYADRLACVELDGKSGYINEHGKIVIEPRFNMAKHFSNNGLAPVQQYGKWGYINEQGKIVIEPRFEDAHSFSANGLAPIRHSGKWGYLNEQGKIVIAPRFEQYSFFSTNGLAPVQQDGKWGYINEQGKIAIEPYFEDATGFFANGRLALVKQGSKWGYINEQGKIVIETRFEFAAAFSANGLALVQQDSKWGYINEQGKIVIGPRFTTAKHFSDNGLAPVQQDGKWGYINGLGKMVIEPRFEEADMFTACGSPATSKVIQAKTGKFELFYSNGQLKVTGNFQDGKHEGLWQYYYENGKRQKGGCYTNGKEDGLWVYYYENGNRNMAGNYINGKEEGMWEFYEEENGFFKCPGMFTDGKLGSQAEQHERLKNYSVVRLYSDITKVNSEQMEWLIQLISEGTFKDLAKERLQFILYAPNVGEYVTIAPKGHPYLPAGDNITEKSQIANHQKILKTYKMKSQSRCVVKFIEDSINTAKKRRFVGVIFSPIVCGILGICAFFTANPHTKEVFPDSLKVIYTGILSEVTEIAGIIYFLSALLYFFGSRPMGYIINKKILHKARFDEIVDLKEHEDYPKLVYIFYVTLLPIIAIVNTINNYIIPDKWVKIYIWVNKSPSIRKSLDVIFNKVLPIFGGIFLICGVILLIKNKVLPYLQNI